MKNAKVTLITLAVALMLPASLFASGFGFYEHSARATGMGGAFVARADDASAINYNPAGIAFLEGKNFSGALHTVDVNASASILGRTTDQTGSMLFIPANFISMKYNDSISFGIGVFVPYGLEVKWPEAWIGNQLSYRSYLRSIYIRPTIAFKVSDDFAIGIGVDLVSSKAELSNKTALSISPFLPTAIIDTELVADGTGVGFTVGALWKASENFQIGAKYQHEIEIDFDGDVDFTPSPSGHPLVDAVASSIFTDQSATLTITMPREFQIGGMYMPSDKWSIEVDYSWTGWSSFETLAVTLENPLLGLESVGNWEDTWMLRVGGEYWVADNWALRAGYIFDKGAVPLEFVQPILPDSDRNEFAFGIGYDSKQACCWGNFKADFALLYIMVDDITSKFAAFPATYEANVLLLGFGLSVSF